jgi:hypothetical protein
MIDDAAVSREGNGPHKICYVALTNGSLAGHNSPPARGMVEPEMHCVWKQGLVEATEACVLFVVDVLSARRTSHLGRLAVGNKK